jgi:eukaryotic-like serine/threonine-protein kinase
MLLAPGGRIRGYELVALIGEGGMGQVSRATDIKLGRAVAVTVLPESFALVLNWLEGLKRLVPTR